MKKLTYILLFILFHSITNAQLTKPVLLQIRLENGVNKPWDNLIIGLAPNATEKMDTAYQEYEIPDFPFPSGIFTAVCLTYDSSEKKDIWSYRSIYGPPKDQMKFMIKYRFRVFYGYSDSVKMSWGTLPDIIDSAILSDNFGGYRLKVNMKEKQSVVNKESLLDNFEVMVYYNLNKLGIRAHNNIPVDIYPNPTKDFISINSSEQISKIEICNFFGNCLFSKLIDNNFSKIDLSQLPEGVYFVKLYQNDNFVIKKLIKE